MLTKVPEGPGDNVLTTPTTPAKPPSQALLEQKSSHHPSEHLDYAPPHQPDHEDVEQPTHKSKRHDDIFAYKNKLIGWDGPVWCSRYGRFENQEDAAMDDGYKFAGQVTHQGYFIIRDVLKSNPTGTS